MIAAVITVIFVVVGVGLVAVRGLRRDYWSGSAGSSTGSYSAVGCRVVEGRVGIVMGMVIVLIVVRVVHVHRLCYE